MVIQRVGLLQMMIRRGQPFANDDPEGPASWKRSSTGGRPLANDHVDRFPAWNLTNDHPEGPAFCKWSSVTPITLVTSARIQIQSREPFWNDLFLFPSHHHELLPKRSKHWHPNILVEKLAPKLTNWVCLQLTKKYIVGQMFIPECTTAWFQPG